MNHPSYTGRVIDAHVHVHPERAAGLRELMDANGLERVVNLGVLERLGIPFPEGRRAFREALGERVILFTSPEFPDHDTLLAQRNRVVERHPVTTFIGAHLGNYPENLAYVDGCLDRFPNLHVDVSARLGEIGRHPAEAVRAFFLKHQDRVVFGTDLTLDFDASGQEEDGDPAEVAAFYDAHWQFFETAAQGIEYPGFPVQGRWHVDAVGLPPVALKKLYARNIQRLVPGLEGA